MMLCVLCFREETSVFPSGKPANPTKPHINLKKRATRILCSRCTSFLIAKGITNIPWDGKLQLDKFENMRRGKAIRLQRRKR